MTARRSMGAIVITVFATLVVGCKSSSSSSTQAADAPMHDHPNPAVREKPVKLGIDVLAAQDFAPLRGKRVGVITNHTGLDSNGTHLVDLLRKNNVNVTTLFGPEHGIYGDQDVKIGDSTDGRTGLPVFSLYGKTRRPTTQSVQDIDVLVFDIQDVGTRFYTYISTLGLCMEAAAEHGLEFVVLDRPNPIQGTRVEGPIADADKLEFTAFRTIPLVHGMTIGELAQFYNGEGRMNCKLTVIPMQGWTRGMWWNNTGVKWVNPSPNLRSPEQALFYPAVGLLESTNIAVGRGTDKPFEQFGAPYIDGRRLADELNRFDLPGVTFAPATWVPNDKIHKFHGQTINGVRLTLTDRNKIDAVKMGMVFAWTLNKLYPNDWKREGVLRMAKNDEVEQKLYTLEDPRKANEIWTDELDAWKATRAKYLIYK